jgi:hypothetical protein
MFVHFLAAVAEILIGLFVYEFFDPEKVKKMPPLLRWGWIDFNFIFNPEKNLYLIKKANRIALKFCIMTAILTILNGLLNVYLNFPDLKEVLIIFTVFGVILIRYGYIFLNKW